ncbi:hypothetical protein HDZ31DRAFT_39074 [Schizophyllum fasciatum]
MSILKVVYSSSWQKLYFDDIPEPDATKEEKELAGQFKGMKCLLEERGLWRDGMKTQCQKKFTKCPDNGKTGQTNCCCRHTLFNQPDFINIPTILQTTAETRRHCLVPSKFHCELNPIKMSWSYSKRVYRDFPFSKQQDVLERNVVRCLKVVPLVVQRRHINRCLRFMNAYMRGLDGTMAEWAVKKCSGHRMVPENIMVLFDAAHAGKCGT